MKKIILITTIFSLTLMGLLTQPAIAKKGQEVQLNDPSKLEMPLLKAVQARRTSRNYAAKEALSLQELSNVLYAMQGQTDGNKRSVPSFYGLYPLNVYVLIKNVEKVENGLYKMDVENFKLELIKAGDHGQSFAAACYGQKSVELAQVNIILTGVASRLQAKLGKDQDVDKWMFFEAGSAAQNGFLIAAAQELKTTPVGGYDPAKVADFLSIDSKTEIPLIVTSFGK